MGIHGFHSMLSDLSFCFIGPVYMGPSEQVGKVIGIALLGKFPNVPTISLVPPCLICRPTWILVNV